MRRSRSAALRAKIHELEESLIPHGLHVVGRIPPVRARGHAGRDGRGAGRARIWPRARSRRWRAAPPPRRPRRAAGIARGGQEARCSSVSPPRPATLAEDSETPALLHALDGGFIRPVAGGDLIRNPDVLPTGRNLHGFDPFRLPSAFAVQDGAEQAARLVARHEAETGALPGSVALVLWGTDNLKTEGGPIGQALALMGARPRFDGYGRLAGAELIPLEELGRPRIDVVMTLSGIFRDLLPLQTKLLAEAAWLAASAEEPLAQNHVRAHTLAYQAKQGCDFDTAALRVFSNAEGAYGSNVNQLVDSGGWGEEDELADSYQKRKCYAYGRDGRAAHRPEMLQSLLGDVDLAYQNLESVELGVTTVDHYFDTLGGIGRAVRRARGQEAPVYIGDQTRGDGKVRTLKEQVALETRTRALNPKWYEGMLRHGHEGVRQIEAHVTNTVGWSATTGAVDPGSISASPRPSCWTRRCAGAWRSSIPPPRRA